MKFFPKKQEPMTAQEHRKLAEEHRAAAKAMRTTFFKTGIIMFAALLTAMAISIAWFVSNTNVGTHGVHISSGYERPFYLATRVEDKQGVYDRNTENSSHLAEALKTYRIPGATFQGLPNFTVGLNTIEGTDKKNYIIGDTEGISLMVNATSNVNNNVGNDYIGPGSRGELTFYIIPNVDGLQQAEITISLEPYYLRVQESENKQSATVSAERATSNTLIRALRGHILLFEEKDNEGYYVKHIAPENGTGDTIRFTLNKTGTDWKRNTPIPVTLYWVWPYRFENLVYPGQPDSIFKDPVDLQKNNPQAKFLIWVNGTEDEEYKNGHKDYIAYTSENLADASAEMSNSDFAKWSNGYNRADQLIGDTVAYFVWTISADA